MPTTNQDAYNAVIAIFSRPQPHIGHDSLRKLVNPLAYHLSEHQDDLIEFFTEFQKGNSQQKKSNAEYEIRDFFKTIHFDSIGNFFM